jgi:hypothetical protein
MRSSALERMLQAAPVAVVVVVAAALATECKPARLLQMSKTTQVERQPFEADRCVPGC